MYKAFYKGWEVYEIDYHSHTDWCEVLFFMDDFSSPITGTGRAYALLDNIEIRKVEAE